MERERESKRGKREREREWIVKEIEKEKKCESNSERDIGYRNPEMESTRND